MKIATSTKYRILGSIFIFLLLPFSVYLARQIVRYFTSAAVESTIFFEPSEATLPPNQTFMLMMDTHTNEVGFARVFVTFDNTKVQLVEEVQITGPLQAIVNISDMEAANQTGRVEIVLMLCDAADVPCDPKPPFATDVFELARLAFEPISPESEDQTYLSVDSFDLQIGDVGEVSEIPVVIEEATLLLNPFIPTPTTESTPTPTDVPTGTPTLTPTPIVTNTPTPTDVPTNTPTERPTSTPTDTVTNTPTPTQAPVAGDATGDGEVDIDDYKVWVNNYNTSTEGGSDNADFNGDGQVDGEDFVIWLTNYGT